MTELPQTDGVAMVAIPLSLWETTKKKAQKWDALDEKIAKFYPEEEGDEEEQGDLIDIGEAAAIAFGYL